ncbi:hypothetical protein M5K25_010934 [Dendrobium thyrsiflorum]|uniref:Uncharacterized protein n=1 Tax=Dendrobium thyrsiflorum TaxID=117978 RepID=A0ABD0V1D0_DENTH
MESRLGGMEEMIKKLMEMQFKAPQAIPIANPQRDLTGVPLAESKGKEIEREEFNEASFFHQEPPPGAPRRGGLGFPDEKIVGREFYGGIYGGSGRETDYGRPFGQGEASHPFLPKHMLDGFSAVVLSGQHRDVKLSNGERKMTLCCRTR